MSLAVEVNLNKDPSLYTVWMPTLFLEAKWGKQPELPEEKAYLEVLAYNHVAEPERLEYNINYAHIFPESSFRNRHVKALAMALKESLHNLTFFFDEKKMEKIFPDMKHLRSISVFITVDYHPKYFTIHLHPDYKKVLIKSFATGFTKGDIDFIRATKCKYSPRLYFRVRYWQFRTQKRELSIEEFRSILEIDTALYQDVRNLRRKVLDVIKNEFEGTFVEFTYGVIKEGAKIVGFTLLLKNGPDNANLIEIGKGYAWETVMKQYGVYTDKILKFRNLVRDEVAFNNIIWDSDYINYSIDAFQEEIRSKKKNLKLKQVKAPAAYLVEGLENAYWLSFVIKRKKEMEDFRTNLVFKDQINLPFSKEEKKQRMITADRDEFIEVYKAHLAIGIKNPNLDSIRITEQGLEEFIIGQGYIKEGNSYVQYLN